MGKVLVGAAGEKDGLGEGRSCQATLLGHETRRGQQRDQHQSNFLERSA